MSLQVDLNGRLAGGGFRLTVSGAAPAGRCTAIFGPSGSGKTSLLHAIAGVGRIAGSVHWQSTTWQDERVWVPAHRRRAALVTQGASVFPHLSVTANLQYAARRAGLPAASPRVEQVIDQLGLGAIANQKGGTLSGGEAHRVTLARALVATPPLLLLDEPLAALDREARLLALAALGHYRAREQTMMFVTHSAAEVAQLADAVWVLENGTLVDSGPTEPLLARQPAESPLGRHAGVALAGRIESAASAREPAIFDCAAGRLRLATGLPAGSAARVRVLARDVSIALPPAGRSSILNVLTATVHEVVTEESDLLALVTLNVGNSRLIARLTVASLRQLDLHPGMQVLAQIKSASVTVGPAVSDTVALHG